MADLIDEYGNPVQLTDQHGNPVTLTDEHGNPMQLTGVATSPTKAAPPPLEMKEPPPERKEVPFPGGVTAVYVEETTHVMSGPGTGVVSGAQLDPLVTEGVLGSDVQPQVQDLGIGGGAAGVGVGVGHHQLKDQLNRSTSSSSSEDDGQGGRRKKGIKQKLKETFGVGKHKHALEHTPPGTGGGITHAAPPAMGEVPHHEPPEKKSMMEKIKEKLPGHHHTSSEGK